MAPKRKAAAKKEGATAASSAITGPNTGNVDGGVVDPRRRRLLTSSVPAMTDAARGKNVLYWMSRDQRVQDNWALLHARDIAKSLGVVLYVVFILVPKFLEATLRHYDFMLRGLREVEEELRSLNYPFKLLRCSYGGHGEAMHGFCQRHSIGTVVCDMSPLRVPRAWTQEVVEALEPEKICCVQVDAHNIVPVWQASDKQETAARTIRSKITNQYGEFLVPLPVLENQAQIEQKQPQAEDSSKAASTSAEGDAEKTGMGGAIDWSDIESSLEIDRTVKPVDGLTAGITAARRKLASFCKSRLEIFAAKRNDPNVDALSGLSPYLHFGQISAQRCALEVKAAAAAHASEAASSKAGSASKQVSEGCESFLEEAIVRRELADNFCWYQEKYDSLEGAAGWAQETLRVHSTDKREHLYSEEQLEAGKTHDDLWNASQLQMVREGKMHGFLRMYWAKKILEWTPTPAEALRIAIRLNDRYELDGRDPNGYVGVMWSIAGIHDMGWKEREVFGKIRFMNYAGCKRKFDVAGFVSRYIPESASAESPRKKAKAKAKP